MMLLPLHTVRAILQKACPTVGVSVFAVAMLLALPCADSHADGYYRWRDANGQMHFSQRPPPQEDDIDAELISPRTGLAYPKPEKKPAPIPVSSATPEPDKPEQEVSRDTTRSPFDRAFDKDPERCEQARNNLKALSRSHRIRFTDAEGKQRLLSDKEKQAQQAAARKAIEESC